MPEIHGLAALMGKNFSLYTPLNLSCLNYFPFSPILLPRTTVENLAVSPQYPPVSMSGLLLGVPKPSFLQAEQAQLPQPPLAGPVLQPPPPVGPSIRFTLQVPR